MMNWNLRIDIPNHKLEVELTNKEINNRLARLPEFEPKVKTGYLRRYAESVGSANTGAILRRTPAPHPIPLPSGERGG